MLIYHHQVHLGIFAQEDVITNEQALFLMSRLVSSRDDGQRKAQTDRTNPSSISLAFGSFAEWISIISYC